MPTSLPNRTLDSTPEEHVSDHNVLHAFANLFSSRVFVEDNDLRLSDERIPVDGSVTQAKLANGLLSNFISSDDVRLNDTREPRDGSVSTVKIAEQAVTMAKLASDVTSAIASGGGGGSGGITQEQLEAAIADEVADRTAADNLKIDTAKIGATGAGGVAGYDDTQTKLGLKVGKGDIVVNVEDYRSSTDGSDTAVIQAALAVLQAADGGTVLFPKKLYTTSATIVPRRNFRFLGNSTGTVIKLADGANVDLIKTLNFDSLTGGSTQAGPDRFRLENLTLDGNGANQTSTSWTFRCYGSNYSVENVEFRNGYSGNVWSEWGTGGTNMEASWSNFKVVNSINGNNLVWAGPHDSSFTNGFVFRDGTTVDGIGDGITTQGNAGGEMFTNVHVWGGHVNGWMLNKLAICSNCVSEGAKAINVLINAMRSTFDGTVYGRSSGTGPNEVGVQVGVSGGAQISGWLLTVTSWQWNATTSIPFNFVNDGGGAALSTVFKTTATSIRSGTINPKSAVTLNCADVPDQSLTYSPRLVLLNANGSAVLIGNGTKDMYRFVSNSTDGLIQLPNNTSLRGYSDAYTTETLRLDSSTGVGAFKGVRQSGVQSKTSAYTAVASDSYINANGTFTVTLPAAVLGQRLVVKNTGTGTITVAPATGTIDGSATDTISVQYDSHTYYSDGTNWFEESALISNAVTTTGTQTLANKTLTTPTITSINNGGTISVPSGAGTLATIAATQTLTNKRVNKRVTSLTAGTTYTPAGDTSDVVTLAAPTGAFTINAPSGTPVDGQQLILRLRMGTTVYAPTWNAIYLSSGVATLPTSYPTASKTYTHAFSYDSSISKWVLMAVDGVGY